MEADFFPLQTPRAEWRGAPALYVDGEVIPYARLHQLVGYVTAGLEAEGIGRGDRVAIWAPNSPELVLLLLGLWRAGAVGVPVNTRLPVEAWPGLFRQIRPAALVLDTDTLPVPTGCLCPLFDLRHWIHWQAPGGEWASLRSNQARLDDPVTVVFTSGTTGQPRAVLHSLANHYYNALGSNQNIGLEPGDVWLLSLPLYHVGGLGILFRCFLAGAAVGLTTSQDLPEALSTLPVTHLSLVPTQLYRLLQEEPMVETLRGLKAILLGGAPLPERLLEKAVALGLPVCTTYGCTEMASQVTTTAPGDSVEVLRTSGRLLPYRKLAITDEGELLLGGKTRCVGFLEDGEVVYRFDARGLWPSGDLGRLTEQGCLQVIGRKDNLFISGGENIYPEEIEQVMLRHPACEHVLVVPVPDEEFGHRPAAFVQSPREISPEEWREFLAPLLPGYKIPRLFWAWPREHPMGLKPSRRRFQELARRKLES